MRTVAEIVFACCENAKVQLSLTVNSEMACLCSNTYYTKQVSGWDTPFLRVGFQTLKNSIAFENRVASALKKRKKNYPSRKKYSMPVM